MLHQGRDLTLWSSVIRPFTNIFEASPVHPIFETRSTRSTRHFGMISSRRRFLKNRCKITHGRRPNVCIPAT